MSPVRLHGLALLLVPIVAGGLAASLGSCGSSATPPDVTPPANRFLLPQCTDPVSDNTPLATRCNQFVDADGRVVVLHGINARVEGLFDVTFDDGRVALEDIPEFTAEDANRMRQMGFNLLRLPVNWSGIEPDDTAPPTYSATYLDRLEEVIDLCRDAGLYVIIDYHQDAYSKEIGEDGAPLWAIAPPPTMLLEGPLTDLGARRESAQVLAAFRTFFGDDEPGPTLRGRFAEMAIAVATRFRDDNAVIGYEIMNEPIGANSEVLRLNVDTGRAIQTVDTNHLIVFEPDSASRLVLDRASTFGAPFELPGGVYAPHVYTLAFSGDEEAFMSWTRDTLRAGNEAAFQEANAWNTPLFIGEFGFDPVGTRGIEYLNTQTDLQDEFGASAAFWVWKEDSQDSWGLHDFDASTDTWVERPVVRQVVSRPMPERFSGQPLWWQYDRTARVLRVALQGDGAVSAPNQVYIPEPADFSANYSVTCDGAAVSTTRDPATGLIDVPCRGSGPHLIVVAAE